MDIKKTIAKLIRYGELHLYLGELDSIYARNFIMARLHVDDIYEGEIDDNEIEAMEVPDELIKELDEYIDFVDGLEKESLITEIMSYVSPSPDIVVNTFFALKDANPVLATEYLYDVSVKNYYVQKTKVDKNILWISKDGIEISINLSKPEKDNKDIKKLLTNSGSGYPKCVLCIDNIGYQGRDKFPPRQNIRFIPLHYNDQEWFLQFSPYGYYNRHCILIKKEHEPMHVNRENMAILFEFVDDFPHYMIGSNSDLPITGGSILNHEHFQGGEHLFPMLKRDYEYVVSENFMGVKIGKLDWYNSVVKFESKDKKAMLDVAEKVLNTWLKYENKACDIIKESNGERHNSITPILRKDGDIYHMYIILRNNRTNETHPGGIFHAHEEYHHIKKEGIGLIEAMGEFILPARLARQLPYIEHVLKDNISKETYLKESPDMEAFVPMIESLRNKKGDYHEIVKDNIEDVCRNILHNTAVFKDDEKGKEGFREFFNALLSLK